MAGKNPAVFRVSGSAWVEVFLAGRGFGRGYLKKHRKINVGLPIGRAKGFERRLLFLPTYGGLVFTISILSPYRYLVYPYRVCWVAKEHGCWLVPRFLPPTGYIFTFYISLFPLKVSFLHRGSIKGCENDLFRGQKRQKIEKKYKIRILLPNDKSATNSVKSRLCGILGEKFFC